jgi:hypothetical protein
MVRAIASLLRRSTLVSWSLRYGHQQEPERRPRGTSDRRLYEDAIEAVRVNASRHNTGGRIRFGSVRSRPPNSPSAGVATRDSVQSPCFPVHVARVEIWASFGIGKTARGQRLRSPACRCDNPTALGNAIGLVRTVTGCSCDGNFECGDELCCRTGNDPKSPNPRLPGPARPSCGAFF